MRRKSWRMRIPDQDGDGISGRANRVRSEAHGHRLGRFGWKAEQATIADQNAVALSNDIGIGNPLYPALWGDCTIAQTGCRQAPHGGSERHGGLEVSAKVARHLTFYLQGWTHPQLARRAKRRTTLPQDWVPTAIAQKCGPALIIRWLPYGVGRSDLIPICCYTIWGKGSRTIWRKERPRDANGAPRRSGE